MGYCHIYFLAVLPIILKIEINIRTISIKFTVDIALQIIYSDYNHDNLKCTITRDIAIDVGNPFAIFSRFYMHSCSALFIASSSILVSVLFIGSSSLLPPDI